MASISNKSTGSKLSDDTLFKAAIRDAIRLCDRRSSPRYVGFLDERQRAVAQQVLHREGFNNFSFFGGYNEAERTFLGVFPEYMQPKETAFPISKLAFSYRVQASLNHRDFLGTMLSFGIKRDTIGDILCGNGFTVAFIEKEISRFLEGQITKVGGEGVTLLCDYQDELPALHTFREIRDTVASPRLDAIVKVAAGISREKAAHCIAAGQVSVNHVICQSISNTLREKDILSIRGVGRFVVDVLGPVTRKGRLFITIKKYL